MPKLGISSLSSRRRGESISPASPSDKCYTVGFSSLRIVGLGSWDAAAVVHPGTERLDRRYGGDPSNLWTDVMTQRGDVAAGAGSGYAKLPEWQAMADEWGLHFRLEVFDEKAPEMALGLSSPGSLEGYIATGEDAPHHAILHSFSSGGLSVYNCVYSQVDHREIDSKDRARCREEVAYTPESVILYIACSWENWAMRAPVDGSVWEFEPMFWGRKANCSWNGLRTIHGRSSWGRLKFALTDGDRRRILRPLLVAARREYEDEKRPHGEIGRWRNEEVGDPRFYDAVVKPMAERLDAAASRVTAEMDDATVDELASGALHEWLNFRFNVQRLRAAYLAR